MRVTYHLQVEAAEAPARAAEVALEQTVELPPSYYAINYGID